MVAERVLVRNFFRALIASSYVAGATAVGGPAAGAAAIAALGSPLGVASVELGADQATRASLDSTKMAMGGIVTEPTFAMIGEAGPEMVIPLVATKVKRKTTKYQKELGRQLSKQNKLHRLKNGSLRKGKTTGMLLSTAHKLTKRALGTKKGQVRKTARRAFRR